MKPTILFFFVFLILAVVDYPCLAVQGKLDDPSLSKNNCPAKKEPVPTQPKLKKHKQLCCREEETEKSLTRLFSSGKKPKGEGKFPSKQKKQIKKRPDRINYLPHLN